MISLRTFGADSNTFDSSFVGFARPVGVQDGDVVIAALAIPLAGVVITAPVGWTLAKRVDPQNAINVAVYWRVALNEPSSWVFALSASIRATGIVLVYSGVDQFNPVEVANVAQTASSSTQAIPGVSTSLNFEQVIYILAAGTGSVLYTEPTGFTEVVRITHDGPGGSTIEAQHRLLSTAGAVAPTTSSASPSTSGAVVALVLAPSYSTHSVAEIRDRLVGALPTGADRVYDLTPTGDYHKFFTAIAAVLKLYGYDTVDTLRRESAVRLCRYVLPTWERVFGLQTSKTAKLGTIPQRQAQVVAAWRAASGQGASIPEVQAAIAPLLGYASAANVQIVEVNRNALTDLHTYQPIGIAPPYAIPVSSSSVVKQFYVSDDARVGQMGAQVNIWVTHADVSQMSAHLVGPNSGGYPVDPISYVPVPGDGIANKSWPAGALGSGSVTNKQFKLYAVEAAGKYVLGTWSLLIINADAVNTGSVTVLSLFTEGVGRDSAGGDGLGAAAFEWSVYADPLYLGGSGTPADFDAARAMIQRMKQAHTIANLLQSLDGEPWPNVDAGVHAAIPDESIPA